MNKCSRPFWALLYLSGHALNFYAVYHLYAVMAPAAERERQAALTPEELAAGEKINFDDLSADAKQKVYVGFAWAGYLATMFVWGLADTIKDSNKLPDSSFKHLSRGLCGGWRQLFGPARKEAVRKSLFAKAHTQSVHERALKVSNNKPGGFAYIFGESAGLAMELVLCCACLCLLGDGVGNTETPQGSTVVQPSQAQAMV